MPPTEHGRALPKAPVPLLVVTVWTVHQGVRLSVNRGKGATCYPVFRWYSPLNDFSAVTSACTAQARSPHICATQWVADHLVRIQVNQRPQRCGQARKAKVLLSLFTTHKVVPNSKQSVNLSLHTHCRPSMRRMSRVDRAFLRRLPPPAPLSATQRVCPSCAAACVHADWPSASRHRAALQASHPTASNNPKVTHSKDNVGSSCLQQTCRGVSCLGITFVKNQKSKSKPSVSVCHQINSPRLVTTHLFLRPFSSRRQS